MLRKDAKVELLRGVPLFSRCSKKQLAEIAAIADLVDMPAGRTLMREGARGSEFFVIVDGEVEVKRGGRTINTLGPGDFVGEMALISRRPRNATVTTTRDAAVLAITERQFWTLLEQAPAITTSLLKAIGDRMEPTIA